MDSNEMMSPIADGDSASAIETSDPAVSAPIENGPRKGPSRASGRNAAARRPRRGEHKKSVTKKRGARKTSMKDIEPAAHSVTNRHVKKARKAAKKADKRARKAAKKAAKAV